MTTSTTINDRAATSHDNGYRAGRASARDDADWQASAAAQILDSGGLNGPFVQVAQARALLAIAGYLGLLTDQHASQVRELRDELEMIKTQLSRRFP